MARCRGLRHSESRSTEILRCAQDDNGVAVTLSAAKGLVALSVITSQDDLTGDRLRERAQ